jgi:hypothetical protein
MLAMKLKNGGEAESMGRLDLIPIVYAIVELKRPDQTGLTPIASPMRIA